jgi:CheY-like chemotaxis protein
MRPIIVAVADDDITHYLTLKAIFSRLPVISSVIHFTNGKELYDFLRQNVSNESILPDYIFLDIYMPKMDGWKFLNKFKDMQEILSKKIAIYINSGSNEHRKRAMKNPLVKDYLRKPISESEIQAIFAEIKG